MSDTLADLLEGKKDGQSMKATEITGDRFLFHSLPKEFQDWHTTYFILEQRGELDGNTVSKAVFNGYMWKTFADASLFGFVTGMAIIFAILKMKSSPNLLGFGISMILYLPWLLYTIYHFTFYAYIRAQVVGPLTYNGYKNISLVFYQTFTAIVIALVLAGMVSISFLDSINDLIGALINTGNGSGVDIFGYNLQIKGWLLSTHGTITELLKGPDNFSGMVFFNEWIMGVMFLFLTFGTIFVYERDVYAKHKVKMDLEVKKAKASSGYPIESALETLWEWRKKYGV